ncbi:MAG: transketolase, partial [Sedimentisphaerales bacterium]|nr:transketolase [Sedimentisphaerales bacterium]
KANRIRRQVLQTVYETRKGHIGGTFSCTDIFVVLYYGGFLKIDPQNPEWAHRDRLVVGKGHACLALYNIFVDIGLLEASRLAEYGRDGGSLSGQLCIDTPGVEYNTGSLGHAIGVAAGMALAGKLDGAEYKVFALVGDGECAEGSIWESAAFSSEYQLGNLIVIVDCNRLSVTDVVRENEDAERLREKFEAFGWDAVSVDGHSFQDLVDVFSRLDNRQRPLVVIANTVKGKGITFMENGVKWHHSVPNREEFEQAMADLETVE